MTSTGRSIAVGVYMDALALDLGDDLGEVEDLHGDLAGAGDLGVEDVIGEIGPARDAQMQGGLAVRPPQPDQAHDLALGVDHCGDAVERARELAAIDDREAAGRFRNQSPVIRIGAVNELRDKRNPGPSTANSVFERASRTILHLL